MTAARKNLPVEQGATFRFPFTWYEGDKNDPGTPRDLTGATAHLQIREAVGSRVLLDATTENGKIELGGEKGTVLLYFTADDTRALTMRTALYDLEVTLASGEVYRLLEGKVIISPNITRAEGE